MADGEVLGRYLAEEAESCEPKQWNVIEQGKSRHQYSIVESTLDVPIDVR